MSALVGIYQAENKPNLARRHANIAYLYGQFLVVVSLILLHEYSHKLLRQYLNNEETIEKIINTFPLYFAFVLLNASYGFFIGIVKGLGKQSKGAFWTFICFYCISLPLAYFLGFKAQFYFEHRVFKKISGYTGLYIGFLIGLVCINIALICIIYCLDWR